MSAGERRSGIRCLTLVRITAASVVALAFTATVIVVVLTTGFGPDKVRLSVTHGHIQSAGLLWSRQEFTIEHLRKPYYENITYYTPENELTMWMSMDAHDPTRRATNICVTAIDVLDMPEAPYFDDMVHIGTVINTITTGDANKPCAPWRHNGSAIMQLDRWITVNDPLMLCYLSQKYGGIDDITVMLKVDMEILYPNEEDCNPKVERDTHYCWPVSIGHTHIRSDSDAVTCKPSHAIDYASYATVLNPCNLTAQQLKVCPQVACKNGTKEDAHNKFAPTQG